MVPVTYCPDIKVEDYMSRWLGDSVKGWVRTRTYERYESVSRALVVPGLGHIVLGMRVLTL